MGRKMATSNNHSRIIQFLGFSGVAALISLAVMIGRYQNSMDTALSQQVKLQGQVLDLTKSVVSLAEAVHMNQYRIAKLEEHK